MTGAWPTARLDSLAEIVGGGTPSRSESNYFGGSIPWVTPKDMKTTVVLDTIDRITKRAVDESTARVVPSRSVLVVVRSGILKHTFPVAVAGVSVAINQDIKALICGERLDPGFLSHYLRASQNRVLSWVRATTAENIPVERLRALEVPLPPLLEQSRIAAVLDKVDELRRKREKSRALLNGLIDAAFIEMFGDPVRNDRAWHTQRLGEIATIRRGASPRPIRKFLGGTVPWIKIGDATSVDGLYIERTEEHVTEEGASKSVVLDPGAVVVANSGVSLGFARILRIRGCIHDGWLSIEQIDSSVRQIYFVCLINMLTAFLRDAAPSGTQPNLNTTIMRNLRIPLPPVGLQDRFIAYVERAGALTASVRAAERRVVELGHTLALSTFA